MLYLSPGDLREDPGPRPEVRVRDRIAYFNDSNKLLPNL